MISVTYPVGKVKQFDLLSDAATRKQLAASLMTVPEMVAFFVASEAKTFAKQLGLDTTGSEKDICTRIRLYFWKTL